MKKFVVMLAIFLTVFLIIYIGINITTSDKSEKEITLADANGRLQKMYRNIEVTTAEPIKGKVDLDPISLIDTLPEIDKFPVSVQPTTSNYVEIFSSTEKSGSGHDGWINEVAEAFNAQRFELNGKQISVKIRNIASGTAADFIRSGKYIPTGFTPSNELWGEMVKASGIETTLITERLIGNVAGIVISKEKYDFIVEHYGEVSIGTMIEAIANNELSMGYTDPFASSTGLNFLVGALQEFDEHDMLSANATARFETFQQNVPFIASTTLQMREAAKSGMLDAFVLEYQTYVNAVDFKAGYEFIPFGMRHDSPLYGLGQLTADEKQILERFAAYVEERGNQALGEEHGFNGLNTYAANEHKVDGATLIAAQRLWKDKKNASRPVAAIFVADVSGSMDGEPLNRLKQSLISGQKSLGRDNSIGLLSYSSSVEINVPLAKYDTNQQSLFVGAVESLQAGGGTATYDAIAVALKLLQDELQVNPNSKPLIFVLSDGETNEGHSFKEIKRLVEAYKIPIYTIGYNANIDALHEISIINEAASINADVDDVVYKISQLLNVQM